MNETGPVARYEKAEAEVERLRIEAETMRSALSRMASGMDGALTAPIFLPYMETAQFCLNLTREPMA